MFESGHKKPEKRKKVKGGDAEEIDNFLGPWAKYLDEKSVAKPTEVSLSFKMYHEIISRLLQPGKNNLTYTHHVLQRLSQEEKKELDEITAKRQKKGRNEEEAPGEEKTILHGTVASQSVMSLTRTNFLDFITKFLYFFLCPQSKTCTTTRVDPTFTSRKMWASTCAHQTFQTNVTCLKNNFTFGLDTPR